MSLQAKRAEPFSESSLNYSAEESLESLHSQAFHPYMKGFLSPDEGLRLEPSVSMFGMRVPPCHTESHPSLLSGFT